MRESATRDNELIIEQVTVKRRAPSNHVSDIPKPKERKLETTGRVGIAERKASASISVIETKTFFPEITVEIAPDDNTSYDIPMNVVEEQVKDEEGEEEVIVTGTIEPHGPIRNRRKLLFSQE